MLDSVRVENTGKAWIQVTLSKYELFDKFTFDNEELEAICGGKFSSANIEIIEVFDTTMTLAFIQTKENQLLTMKLKFSAKSSVEKFFQCVHLQRIRVIIFFSIWRFSLKKSISGIELRLIFKISTQAFGEKVYIGKLLQYKMGTGRQEDPLLLLPTPVDVYHENLNAIWFPNMKTFNFVYHNFIDDIDNVLLVLLSKTFNLSPLVPPNKYILCAANFPTLRFFLYFPQNLHATRFYNYIEGDLNDEIPCPVEKWVTYKLLTIINNR